MKADRKTDEEKELEENDLDTETTVEDEEGLTNDCNDDEERYDEQSSRRCYSMQWSED